jgi:hypothetical protein
MYKLMPESIAMAYRYSKSFDPPPSGMPARVIKAGLEQRRHHRCVHTFCANHGGQPNADCTPTSVPPISFATRQPLPSDVTANGGAVATRIPVPHHQSRLIAVSAPALFRPSSNSTQFGHCRNTLVPHARFVDLSRLPRCATSAELSLLRPTAVEYRLRQLESAFYD